jgi:hypothetical protein
MNEENKFLEDLDPENKPNPLDAAVFPEEKEIIEPEEVPENIKNRQHRRLEAKLQAEREANIELSARLEAIAEAKRSTESESEYLSAVERIYGTNTPEALTATDILKNALKGVKEEAKEEALAVLREEQRQAEAEVAREVDHLDSIQEEIEDTYGVDLSSPEAKELRQTFFKRLERLSPKDSDGNVIEYADHHAIWEDLQSKIQKRTESRAKDLSARSMVNSGSPESKLTQSAHEKWLLENGII